MNTEEFQKLVLEELKGIDNRLDSELKGIDNRLDVGLKGINNRLDSELKGIKEELKKNQEIQDERFNVIDDCFGELKKGQEDIKNEIKILRKDIISIETVTASNYTDIVRLKAIR